MCSRFAKSFDLVCNIAYVCLCVSERTALTHARTMGPRMARLLSLSHLCFAYTVKSLRSCKFVRTYVVTTQSIAARLCFLDPVFSWRLSSVRSICIQHTEKSNIYTLFGAESFMRLRQLFMFYVAGRGWHSGLPNKNRLYCIKREIFAAIFLSLSLCFAVGPKSA